VARGGARRSPERKQIEALERKEAAERAARRRRWLIGGGVTALLVGAVVFLATRPPPAALAQVETIASQGQLHIDPSGPIPEYNSNPPTSGPHAPTPYQCGIYREPVPDVYQVHNLEHGVVIIQYDPSISESDRNALERFGRGRSHTLVAPREGMDHPIVLTAWTKRLALDTRDDAAIAGFYSQFAQFGPERGVACPFVVDQSQG
jgi:hypothetical protein